MMGLSLRCYIPSFVEIGLPVPEKKIFKRFLPYMGNFKKNEDFSVIKFFVNFKDEIHIHFI